MQSDYTEIILKNDEFLSSLLADINQAQKSIDLEYYIFESDEVGMQVVNAVCQAAVRGVKIRVIVDGIGSLAWSDELTQKMEQCGIQVRIYHPVPFLGAHWARAAGSKKTLLNLFSKLNTRDHKKVSIIDGQIVYVGSANITKHLSQSPELMWRETSVKLVGADSRDLQFAFERVWGGIPLRKRLRMVLRPIESDPLFRINNSFRRRYVLHHALLKRIEQCQKRIWITISYFIPENHLLKKLRTAKRHGVDVRILLPSKSDVLIESLVATTFYAELLKENIFVYEYLPCMLHVKALILDDWCCIGSSNLNNRSLRHDLEVDVNVRSREAVKTLEQQFGEDVEDSRKMTAADLKKQSILAYWLGRLILIVRYWI